MSCFVPNINRGLVNLDHVAFIEEPHYSKESGTSWECFDIRGNGLGVLTADPNTTTAAIIPNNSPITALEFWDEAGVVQYSERSILAWRIEPQEYVHPVFLGSLSDNVSYCYVERIGDKTEYIFPDECTLESLEEALVYASKELKAIAQINEARLAQRAPQT